MNTQLTDYQQAKYTQEYKDKFQQALEFQDFVACQLMRRGLMIVQFGSQEYQSKYGESANGVEVKFDRLFRQTGNLYFETAERTSTSKGFVPSGIHRADNTWLWVIGDYSTLFIFPKNVLQLVERRFIPKITATSKGYVMPLSEAKKLAAKIIEVKR